jgi:hypothetical protein
VIQTKGTQGWFVCDSGENHEASFAPQPIASAGILYLMRVVGEDWKFQDDLDDRTKRAYPGGIGEAVQQMDIWDDAVSLLDEQGLVDASKVGIIGYSRTGWQVEFDLVHARTRYAAATAADNVQFSLSDYFLYPWLAPAIEQMYGGPPMGDSLANWRRYSISFNLDKVHTPLLMEAMGYGVHDDVESATPLNLAIRYEIYNGLRRLEKPVELYYYPNEQHTPEAPKARLASLQRNIDWYRFWLLRREDLDPSKVAQYERWRVLRKLTVLDLEASGQSATTHPKPPDAAPN